MLKIKIETCDEIVNEPLCYNKHFKNTSLFIRNCYNNGITHIRNLFTGTGYIIPIAELKPKYNMRGTFLDYEMVIHNIPENWKGIVQQLQGQINLYNCAQLMTRRNKGRGEYYNILSMNVALPTAQNMLISINMEKGIFNFQIM